ncbi:hypothetical protein WK39_27915 [Burkholderia cepacia]|nr:hypothetical protein WK39_27915 [Burkholderia cepacia]KVS65716.1 hypothetical protein WK40_12225 [Burkholderia cepacia]KWO49828.1 hypothetical protein WT98_17715 [Burkholderia territorii]
MMGFQQHVYYQPAPAVEGDFASANPRASVLAGPGSLVAGPAGVTVGRFAWATSTGQPDVTSGETDFYNLVSNTGVGPPTGFVHREQQALITTWLAEASMLVPAGLPVTLHQAGDFWVRNAGAGPSAAGQKAFANLTDGAVQSGAAGATVAGTVETKWFVMSAAAPGELMKISSWPLG